MECVKTKVEAMGIDNIEGQHLEELEKWTDIAKNIVYGLRAHSGVSDDFSIYFHIFSFWVLFSIFQTRENIPHFENSLSSHSFTHDLYTIFSPPVLSGRKHKGGNATHHQLSPTPSPR